MTFGARGSHHGLATAVFARELGFRATLILGPQPPSAHAERTLQTAAATGARILTTRSMAEMPVAALRGALAGMRAGEGLPYWIAGGGSSALGTLGYVAAGLELAAQVRRGEAPLPDYVYVAAGTCGTLAGLSLGLWLGAREVPELAHTRLIGVRVVPGAIANDRRLHRLRRSAARLLERAGVPIGRDAGVDATVLGGQLGAGYGHATRASAAAADDACAYTDLAIEPTYTAKALAGLRAFATDHRRHATHLFVHTYGGTPNLARP
jgi:D-cysteine desulfhydrase